MTSNGSSGANGPYELPPGVKTAPAAPPPAGIA
jgi:hypothetical protein